jgi:hypothetical protein
MAKGVDTSDETKVVKGGSGYTVVWEDEAEETRKEEEKRQKEEKKEEKREKEEEKERERQKQEEKKEDKREKDAEKGQKSDVRKDEKKDDDKKRNKRESVKGHADKHKSMLPYYVLMGLTLLWLLFVNYALFIMAVAITALILYAHFRETDEEPDSGVMRLEIIHPIKTGFEIALGMGLFAFVCILIGALIVGLLIFGAAFGFWSGLSTYLP